MRDGFTQKTKDELARRAGYLCSKPDCEIQTVGAKKDDDGHINIGVAAHITAASPGGPRYDANLKREERNHQSNGIWLCQTYAKLVDSDDSHFTVEELRRWKKCREERSFLAVITSKPSPNSAIISDDDDVQKNFDIALLNDCFNSDLSAFQEALKWTSEPVTLNLRMMDEDRSRREVFTVSGLASGFDVYDQFTVIAAPGTGKTTTLLQLVKATLDNSDFVAVFIPLGEWATGSDSFFQSLLRRKAFRGARQEQFELIAQNGKLVLILDSWNELDFKSQERVRRDLNGLRRDFPDLRVVISSRYRDSDIPIDGPVVEIDLLTEDQQLELAKSLLGTDSESLIDHAWRTPGLRELVAIPLYLTTLLKAAPIGGLPTTKEKILRSFVFEFDRDRDKSATLRDSLQGFHMEFLEEIAVSSTENGTVGLTEKQARSAVCVVQNRLKEEQQIAELFQPMNVLSTLVDAHMLVRSDMVNDSVWFRHQHQQFQEWFASFRVQQKLLSASQGDDEARNVIREKFFDLPCWEEAVLFACDRLSRADEKNRNAVAWAILETLGIDPLFSAEMIFRSSDDVWGQVRNDVVSFARSWHTPGRVDRAVTFMIDTGRAEFSELVWPLISNEDNQVHLSALRAGRRFRPGVLGSNAKNLIAKLPEDVREHVISEIASLGDMVGIELATSLAKADKSPKIKKSTIESLFFRRADRFAKEILDASPDEVWQSFALEWNSREFSDPEVSARIQEEADKLFVYETDPGRTLSIILRGNVNNPGDEKKVRELVERIDFSDTGSVNQWLIHRAYERYPGQVVAGLIALLEQGKKVPFKADDMLRMSDVVIDNGPLADCVLKHTGDGRDAEIAASIVGPKTVRNLIDQLFELDARIRENKGQYDKSSKLDREIFAQRDEYHRIFDLISVGKIKPFAEAILERSNTVNTNQIYILSRLISRYSRVEGERLELAPETYNLITAAVQRWGETLLASPEATREEFAEIAQAAERLASPKLVPLLLNLLAEDLKRQKRAREELLEARKQGRYIQNDAHMYWRLQYRNAFATIRDQQAIDAMKSYLRNPEFGDEAAHVLKSVWQESQPKEDKSGFLKSSLDFSVVPESYRKRQSGEFEYTHPFVDDIVDAINDIIKPGSGYSDLNHALKLATVAFSMPYSDKQETIDALLDLAIPAVEKRGLLTVLALSGETISSEQVMRGIDELLEESKEKPLMIQGQNGWSLEGWLRLLPFTEQPSIILQVLERLEGFRADPWNLRQLLSALSYAPLAEAEAVLEELAKRDEWFLSENYWNDWIVTLTRRNSLTAARIFLDLIYTGSLLTRADYPPPIVKKHLAGFMTKHGEFRQEVYERFSTTENDAVRTVLASAIANAPDIDGILSLVRVAAAHNQAFHSTSLDYALKEIFLEYRPIESSNIQEVFRIPVPGLRKSLFELVVNGSPKEARLGADCLTAIDKLRDEYGLVDSDPRHPDIASGVPWPNVSGYVNKQQPEIKVEKRGMETSVSIATEALDQIAFQHSVLCQTCMPYRNPGDDVLRWERSQGKMKLLITAGEVVDPHTENYVQLGLPWRLQDPTKRGKSGPNGYQIRAFKDQLGRLSAALIRVATVNGDRTVQIDGKVVSGLDIWFPQKEQQRVLWPSSIHLSLDYFSSLQKHAVPLDERALAALAHSAMALDIYAWLAQRLHRVPQSKPQFISWAALKGQFGPEFGRMTHFRETFHLALRQVLAYYPKANVEGDQGGLTLQKSPPPVSARAIIV